MRCVGSTNEPKSDPEHKPSVARSCRLGSIGFVPPEESSPKIDLSLVSLIPLKRWSAKWEEKSFAGSQQVCAAAVLLVSSTGSGSTQTASIGPAQPGLSFSSVKQALDPVTDFITALFYGIALAWDYIATHPPVAVLLSTIIASIVALISISNHRATTRLRETFSTLNDDNWDRDVIAARKIVLEIRREVANGESISRYASKDFEITDKAETLRTVMNDYENLALGVRQNIIDENYLNRWMRSALINDWNLLSPLIVSYRHLHNNHQIYIEFEGLATSWQQNRAYRNGRKLRRARRKISVD